MGNLTLNGQTVLEQVGTSRPTIGAGFPNIGWKKLASYNWNTNTNYIDFDDVDLTKYINYKVYWYISHGITQSNDTGTHWHITSLRFKTSSGLIESAIYNNNTQWREGTSAPVYNDASFAENQTFIWLAGNGSRYDSQGEVLISIPNYQYGKVSVRGTSQLIDRATTTSNYMESFTSSLHTLGLGPTITGFRIYGTSSTYSSTSYSFPSQYGSVQIMGLEI
jgi:hypothetical protein